MGNLTIIVKDRLLLFLFLLGSVSICGQTPIKRQVTPADYSQWSTLTAEKLAADGKWVSYKLVYDSGKDTVFVQQTTGTKKYSCPSAADESFSRNGKWWAAIEPEKGFGVLNLKTGNIQWTADVVSYEFLANGKYLALLKKAGLEQELDILNMETGLQYTAKDISEYRFNADGKIGVYITKQENAVKLIWLEEAFRTSEIIQSSAKRFKNLIWNKKGNALAFLQELQQDEYQGTNHKLYFLNHLTITPQLHNLDPSLAEGILNGMRIVSPPARKSLEMATDGKKVFFYITATKVQTNDKEIVQVWDGATPWTYPSQKTVEGWQYSSKMAVWWPEENKIFKIGTDEFPKTQLMADGNYALNHNPLQYEPQYEFVSPVDYVLTDVRTGKSKKILQKQIRKFDFIKGSGSGNFINYFKEKHWWVYNRKLDSHINLTLPLGIPIDEVDYDCGGTAPPYGSPGWSADEKYLIVYDQYDVWLLSADGKSRKRLTRGREKHIQYRIAEDNYTDSQLIGSAVLPGNKFDLSNGLLIEAFGDDKSSGYCYWHPDGSIKSMVYKDLMINPLIKAWQSSSYIYREQSFELSPRLMFKSEKRKQPKVLIQTNPQQNHFEWGHSELISYTNSKGTPLQGVLYYPSNFQKGKQYPMIVNIYEKQSHILHHYFNPEGNAADAFPRTNYSLDGYLVLYPDITYEVGEPGKSATDCVVAAVKAVTAKGIVEEEHIGLTGASFGGYETAYIVSQTNIFAAAIAGCPLTDFVSQYLSLDGTGGTPRMWRYESQQQRMGASLFENYQGYIENSPVAQAAKINTPLLLWSGLEDTMVSWTQGLELHLALRRLQKPNQFLVYPGENHSFLKQETKNDLTQRAKEWFDFYLKERPCIGKLSSN
ncbi:alpha/beta hydrolase family protein [Flavobacterium gawalongense]|uniref:Prolyl oligopeptidase family serine peptidase n=1 Tax=Flavobacterium gawalongense TaxID=2594432 RepID=A0ABY3CPY1_9FLAO|nr:prolyl oligopeptidase family serine peptidase [Flavobacterium gawalongense]TRW99022.1 prolyl oligopeptidase family serine peptidase [Flavobacterium gawalongense]TRX09913.1 prolyl oligopeptidase family serine peptidase [Flavobacterium gawalongense]